MLITILFFALPPVAVQATGGTTSVYVSPNGNDSAAGTSSAPLKTITRAVQVLRTQGGEIILMPGVYREGVDLIDINRPDDKPLIIKARDGKDTVFVLGSVSSQVAAWQWVKSDDGEPLPQAAKGNVYYAQVGTFSEAPEIAVITNNRNEVITRLFKAREPDIDPFAGTITEDRRWIAQARGGTDDFFSLIDKASDSGLEAGSISGINGFTDAFLVGARIGIKDAYSGHDENSALITSHDPVNGKVIFDKKMSYFTGRPLVDVNSKYFVEGKAQLLDVPGEWYYNPTKGRLYVYPPSGVNLQNVNVELAVRSKGFLIQNSSNIYLRDLNIQFINYPYKRNIGTDGGVAISNNTSTQGSRNILLDGLNINNLGIGVRIYQATGSGKVTENVLIRNSRIHYTLGFAMVGYESPQNDGNGAYIKAVRKIYLHNNDISYGNYRPTGDGNVSGNMVWFQYLTDIVMTNNRIHHGAHNGIEIHSPGELNLLAQNNIFEENCRSSSDCAGFKVFAGNYAASNVLVLNNIARKNYGCSYSSVVLNKWDTSDHEGCGGFGLYSDIVKAHEAGKPTVIYYNNIIYDNYHSGIHITRSEKHSILNNIFYNNPIGVRFTTGNGTIENNNGTKITGNIFVRDNNRSTSIKDYGIEFPLDSSLWSQVTIDANMYKMTGNSAFNLFNRSLSTLNGTSYKTASEIAAATPWEDAGRDTTQAVAVPTLDLVNVAQLRSQLGMGNSAPAEVSQIAQSLASKVGVTAATNSDIGINPAVPSPQPFTIVGITPPVLCLGDTNGDKVVDLQDYNTLTTNYFTAPPSNPAADFNKDSLVDLEDYNILTNRYFASCN
ncbi:MAG: right-handed parallel beta-helix repeat-containing protein [Candidatus Doudnabacteria bacterium]|nr:right-handed parallel beta-helix repeat-containing protein [Candidatus Doudnabacteria bacterium]